MKKLSGHLLAIAGRVLFIGFSIQILQGIVWMACNFGTIQDFAPAKAGILYPVFLRMFPACVLYVLQAAAALYAGYVFLRAVHPAPFWNLWGSLAMMTVPIGMQCHLALLPDSFISSLLLMQCGLFWKGAALLFGKTRLPSEPAGESAIGTAHLPSEGAALPRETVMGQKEEKDAGNPVMFFAGMCACWLFLALLNQTYFYFGGILPLALLFFVLCSRARARLFSYIILFCAFAGMIFGLYQAAQISGKYEKEQKRGSEMLFDRFVWSTTLRDWGEWHQTLKDSVEGWVIIGASCYSDGLLRDLEPALEQALSREEMDALFAELAKEAWELYPKRIMHECVWDMAGYVFSPAIAGMMLQGRGYESYCLRNYDIMGREKPKLTQFYMDYGSWWFGVAFVLAVLMEAVMFLSAQRKFSGRQICCLAAFVFLGGCIAVWHTMQGAGMMDYKRTIFITGLWTAWQTYLAFAHMGAHS